MSIEQSFKNAEVTEVKVITGSDENGEPIVGESTGSYMVKPEGLSISISVEAATPAAAKTAAAEHYQTMVDDGLVTEPTPA